MDLSGFDFNLLRVLDALLQEKSTVKAAQRIGLSQPAVSAALGRLRHALGDPLFVRQGQKLVPTDFVLSIERQVQEIVDGIARLLARPGDFDPAKSIASFKVSGSDFFCGNVDAGIGGHHVTHRAGNDRSTGGPGARQLCRHPGTPGN